MFFLDLEELGCGMLSGVRTRAEIMQDLAGMRGTGNIFTLLGLIDEFGEAVTRDRREPTSAEVHGLRGALAALEARQEVLARLALADALVPDESSVMPTTPMTRNTVVAELVRLRRQFGI
jgi:hypothetical protein